MAWNDVSDLWWLRTDNQNVGQEAMAALKMGADIAQRRIAYEKEAKEKRLDTALRMIDLGFEKDRNDLALKTFQAKQEAEKLKTEGMLEIGNLMSSHVKDGRTADPEAESEFWLKASRWAPYLPDNWINSAYDNTYGAAQRRKDRAAGRGTHSTITERDWATWRDLKKEERNAVDETHLAEIQQERRMFEQMKGIVDPNSRPEIVTITDPETGKSVKALKTPGVKQLRVLPAVDTSKLSQVEVVMLKKEAEAIDPDNYVKKAPGGGFVFDESSYKADLEKLKEKYTKREAPGKGGIGVNTVPANAPDFEFNPTNRSLVPVK